MVPLLIHARTKLSKPMTKPEEFWEKLYFHFMSQSGLHQIASIFSRFEASPLRSADIEMKRRPQVLAKVRRIDCFAIIIIISRTESSSPLLFAFSLHLANGI